MIRRCAPPRQDARIHLFVEGQEDTLCGRSMEDYHVLPSDATPTCPECVKRVPRSVMEVGEAS